MPSAEVDQLFADVALGDAQGMSNLAFVDESIFAEDAGAGAQQVLQHTVHHGWQVERVEFIAVAAHHHAAAVLLGVGPFDVSCSRQQLQRIVGTHREMAEGMTERFQVELACYAVSVAHSHLQEVAGIFIYLRDVFLRREGVFDAATENGDGMVVVEQHGMGRLPITPGTARLLEIGFGRVGHVGVNNEPYVSLVDAHAESVGGNHHADAPFLPRFGTLGLLAVGERCVVVGGADALVDEPRGQFAGAESAAGIDNS